MNKAGNKDSSYIVDFSDVMELNVTVKLLNFLHALQVCELNKLNKVEHWFSDMLIVEYKDK
jgi:hypothetical protein